MTMSPYLVFCLTPSNLVSRSEKRRSLVRSLAQPVCFSEIDDSHCHRIHSSIYIVQCLDDGYVESSQWLGKNIVRNSGKIEPQEKESKDKCTGRCNITEINHSVDHQALSITLFFMFFYI